MLINFIFDPVQDYLLHLADFCKFWYRTVLFYTKLSYNINKVPNGIKAVQAKTSAELGDIIRAARKHQKVTQKELAAASGTGIRFVRELEKGKPTCELGKALLVLSMLGLKLDIDGPSLVAANNR